MNPELEKLIMSNFIHNSEFYEMVIPYIEEDHFLIKENKEIFNLCREYSDRYASKPSFQSLVSILEGSYSEKEKYRKEEILEKLFEYQNVKPEDNSQFLFDKAEEMAQENVLYNVMYESVNGVYGKDKNFDRRAIPDAIRDALTISFGTKLGYGLFDDLNEQYDEYTSPEERIPFDIPSWTKATNGGISRGKLHLLIAGTGVGKTLTKLYLTGMYMKMGLNVAYMTLEMGVSEIRKRIQANLLDIPLSEFQHGKMPSFNVYEHKINKIKDSMQGDMRIFRYGAGEANTDIFKRDLYDEELRTGFKPDVVMVDYVGLMRSAKLRKSDNSHEYYKAVSEELRNFFEELNVIGWTSSQFNRDGIDSNKANRGAIAGSTGVLFTADYVAMLIRNEDQANTFNIIQAKSRYSALSDDNNINVGIDYSKQRLHELTNEITADRGIDMTMGGIGVETEVNSRSAEDELEDWVNLY